MSTAQIPMLEWLALLVAQHAGDQSSSLFLPTLLQRQRNPAIEPYAAAPLPSVSLPSAPEVAGTLCGMQGGAQENLIATPGAPLAASFTELSVAGLSNARIATQPPMAFPEADAVTASIELSTWKGIAGVPEQLTVSGRFSMSQSCCPTKDFETCAGPSTAYGAGGTFTAELASSTLNAALSVSRASGPGQQGSAVQLAVTVTSLELVADAADLAIAMQLTSVPTETRAAWDELVEEALRSPQARSMFLGVVSGLLADPATLASLGQVLGEAVNGLG